jgi:hypothetical protein
MIVLEAAALLFPKPEDSTFVSRTSKSPPAAVRDSWIFLDTAQAEVLA